MISADALAIIAIAAVLGGGVGARFAQTLPWKGALIALIGAVAVFMLSLIGVRHLALLILAFVVVSGVAGAVAKVGARQTSQVVLGAFLFSFLASVFLSVS